jgi:Conserved mid region of cactin
MQNPTVGNFNDRGQSSRKNGQKRDRSKSPPPPWRNQQRNDDGPPPERRRKPDGDGDDLKDRRDQEKFTREQTRLNQIQEAEQMREWISQEDNFALLQAKKKALIRVKDGRAEPIDWLAVTLRVIDTEKSDNRGFEEMEEDLGDLDVVDPDGVFEGLSDKELTELEREIEAYEKLETNRNNREYWQTMKVICRDRRQKTKAAAPEGRVVSSVASDVDKLLSPKSFEELVKLEKQIEKKLRSNEPIDVDYWEQLLRSLLVWKAKAKLKQLYSAVVNSRTETLRQQQREDAYEVRRKLEIALGGPKAVVENGHVDNSGPSTSLSVAYSRQLDPEPLLKLRAEDKGLDSMEERSFLLKVVSHPLDFSNHFLKWVI